MSHLVLCPVGSAVEVDLTLVPSSPPPIFTAPTRHDVALGVSRLLGAPRDLGPDMDWRERDPVQPSADHLRLFTAYRAHLERALTTAVDWWCRIIRQRELEGRSRDDAILAAFDLVFCGAVSHLDVIGVIRAYWLACEAINAQLPRTSWLAPERMLLAWLLDGHHDSWVAILTAMPYWPLGLDENGVWV